MTPTRTSFRVSNVAALVALGFLASSFCTSLNTAAIWLEMIYAGIAVASLVAVIFWRVERRRDPKASSAGLWIVIAVMILFLLLFLILPSLSLL